MSTRITSAGCRARASSSAAVRALGKRLVLVTNAHPTTLAIKDAHTQVISHFDAGFSSHSFGAPKEQVQFWVELAKVEQFDPARCLFVDDSLPVLRAARAAGIGLIYAVQRPDSSAPAAAAGVPGGGCSLGAAVGALAGVSVPAAGAEDRRVDCCGQSPVGRRRRAASAGRASSAAAHGSRRRAWPADAARPAPPGSCGR